METDKLDYKKINYKTVVLRNNTSLEYLYINDSSNKRPVVFLYGLVCNNRHFEPQINYFTKKNHPVLILNYREHFNSHNPEGIRSCTFNNISEDIFNLLEILNIKGPDIIAHSMGVNVALEMAIQKKHTFNRLVLISGSPMRPQDYMFNTNLSTFLLPAVKKALSINEGLSSGLWKNLYKIKIARMMVLDGGFNQKQVADEFVKFYLMKIGELGYELFFQLIEQMRNHNLITKLHLVENECLIMGGDLDKIAPIEGQILFKKYLKKSNFYLIKDGSHVPQIDFPDSVNDEIDRFLSLKKILKQPISSRDNL
jgi:pimeloyl-ACP methyl ester carboxylesterase